LLSKEVRQIAKAYSGLSGYYKSILNISLLILPNCK